MAEIDFFLVFTILIATAAILYAYIKGKIDLSAVAASGIIGGVALFTVGGLWLYLIVAFFVAGNLVTRYKYDVKEHEGVAEKTRSFHNVFGNGGAAIVYALLYYITRNDLFILGFAGSMATAAADTFATEIGEVHAREPRMITNFRKVRVGTSGAISLPGSIAAVAGAALIAWIPLFFPRLGYDMTMFFAAVTLAGSLGCFVDSVIGATMEKKVWMVDNHMTNFLGTLSGGAFAVFLYSLLV